MIECQLSEKDILAEKIFFAESVIMKNSNVYCLKKNLSCLQHSCSQLNFIEAILAINVALNE